MFGRLYFGYGFSSTSQTPFTYSQQSILSIKTITLSLKPIFHINFSTKKSIMSNTYQIQVQNTPKPYVWKAISQKLLELHFPHLIYILTGVHIFEEYYLNISSTYSSGEKQSQTWHFRKIITLKPLVWKAISQKHLE